MELYQVVILSIVEGATEFLPISSTAHLILTSHLLNIEKGNFLSTFEISVQVGAIGAITFLYFSRIRKNVSLLYKAIIGFVPTGLIGLIVYKYIKLLFNDPFVPVAALFSGGVAIIAIEHYFKRYEIKHKKEKSLTSLTYKDALLIGLMQSISMIPGVSRAASSIFGSMLLKYDRKSAVEFSFLLAIPTMVAATTFDLVNSASSLSNSQLMQIVLGIILSYISALFIVKWLLRFIQKNDFVIFGIYRILLSAVYYFLFLR